MRGDGETYDSFPCTTNTRAMTRPGHLPVLEFKGAAGDVWKEAHDPGCLGIRCHLHGTAFAVVAAVDVVHECDLGMCAGGRPARLFAPRRALWLQSVCRAVGEGVRNDGNAHCTPWGLAQR